MYQSMYYLTVVTLADIYHGTAWNSLLADHDILSAHFRNLWNEISIVYSILSSPGQHLYIGSQIVSLMCINALERYNLTEQIVNERQIKKYSFEITIT